MGIKVVAIVLIICGLVLTVADASHDFAEHSSTDTADSQLMLGVCWSFACVGVMSLDYVAMEWVQRLPNSPSNVKLTWATGVAGVVAGTCYLAVDRGELWRQMAALHGP